MIGAQRAQGHPQLQRIEAAGRLQALVDQVRRAAFGLVAGIEIVGVVGDMAQLAAIANQAGAAAHRLEEGLVVVDADRVRLLDAGEPVAMARREQQPAAVGRIDMQPDAALPAAFGQRR